MKKIIIGFISFVFLEFVSAYFLYTIIVSKDLPEVIKISDIVKIIGMAAMLLLVVNVLFFIFLKVGALKRLNIFTIFFLVCSSLFVIILFVNSMREWHYMVGVMFLVPIIISCLIWQLHLRTLAKNTAKCQQNKKQGNFG